MPIRCRPANEGAIVQAVAPKCSGCAGPVPGNPPGGNRLAHFGPRAGEGIAGNGARLPFRRGHFGAEGGVHLRSRHPGDSVGVFRVRRADPIPTMVLLSEKDSGYQNRTLSHRLLHKAIHLAP